MRVLIVNEEVSAFWRQPDLYRIDLYGLLEIA